MNQHSQLHTNRKTTKFSIKKLIQRTNKSVDFISHTVFQSQQNDIRPSYYPKSMLCSGRLTPKVSGSIHGRRYDVSSAKDSQHFSANKKTCKTFRSNLSQMKKINTHSLSYSRGTQQINTVDNNGLFLTQQKYKYNTSIKKQTFHNNKLNIKTLSNNDERNFEQFLCRLYLQKVRDLRGKPNNKQQTLFVQRYKSKFIFYDDNEEQQKTLNNSISQQSQMKQIKQINLSNSDLGFNSIKWLCEYTLSNRMLQRKTSKSNSLNKQLNNCLIKTLILDQNPLGDQSIQVLVGLITQCKVLQKLSLVSVNMSPKGAKQLLPSLVGLQSLKHLNLSSTQGLNRNRVIDSISWIQTILSNNKCSIQILNLTNINLTNKGLRSLTNGLNKQSRLQQLIISQNSITFQQLPYFLSKIKLTQLTYLDLSGNKLNDQGMRMLCQVIGSSGQRNNHLSRSLKHLNLSSNSITSIGVDAYCKSMLHNQSLTHLSLANNQLSKGEIFHNFKHFISRNWTLKSIDFTNCFDSSDDLRHLFEGLEQNRALQSLILNKNNFSQQAFVFMVRMLNMNKSLKSLQLQSCNIIDKFLIKCERQLVMTKSVQQLNMTNNYLTDKSGGMLIKMVNSSPQLIKLLINKNSLSTRFQQELMFSLKGNKGRIENSMMSRLQNDKQMQYLQYVAEIQSRHQQSIKNSIQKLQQKQSQMRLSSLVCQVVRKEMQQQQCRRQLQQQMVRIKQLENMIIKDTNDNY